MKSKFKPTTPSKKKTPTKQSTLKFGGKKEKKTFGLPEFAEAVDKIDILEGEDKARHMNTVEKKR